MLQTHPLPALFVRCHLTPLGEPNAGGGNESRHIAVRHNLFMLIGELASSNSPIPQKHRYVCVRERESGQMDTRLCLAHPKSIVPKSKQVTPPHIESCCSTKLNPPAFVFVCVSAETNLRRLYCGKFLEPNGHESSWRGEVVDLLRKATVQWNRWIFYRKQLTLGADEWGEIFFTASASPMDGGDGLE